MGDSISKPPRAINQLYHKKHGEERQHPKTEHLQYQNQSHSVYHKNRFAIERRCKSKKGGFGICGVGFIQL